VPGQVGMAVFGLLKDLASQESVVNVYMDSYSRPNVFYCVVIALSATKDPIILFLHSTCHFEV